MEQAPLPTTKVVRAYSLSAEVVAQVEELAAAENRSVSNMVETLLKRGLADRQRTREVVQALADALAKNQAAFREYEMDVDCDPPNKHVEMVDQSSAALALAKSQLQIEPTK